MNKAVVEFCRENSLQCHSITYRFGGKALIRKGIDIVNKDMEILASFEPVEHSVGKWFLRDAYTGYTGPRYFSRITKNMLKQTVNPLAKSYMKLDLTLKRNR